MRWLLVALFTTAAAFAAGQTAAPAAAAASQDSAAADAAGKALVSGVCASCHAADLITSKQAPRTEWKDIVDRMKGYGTES